MIFFYNCDTPPPQFVGNSNTQNDDKKQKLAKGVDNIAKDYTIFGVYYLLIKSTILPS